MINIFVEKNWVLDIQTFAYTDLKTFTYNKTIHQVKFLFAWVFDTFSTKKGKWVVFEKNRGWLSKPLHSLVFVPLHIIKFFPWILVIAKV